MRKFPAVAGALAGAALSLLPMSGASTLPASDPVPVIYEDDPSWNCYTNGNRKCGEDLPVAWIPDEGSRSGFTEVVVLSPANDGEMYGSAEDGRVFHMTPDMLRQSATLCAQAALDDGDSEAAANCASQYDEVLQEWLLALTV